MTKLFKTIRRLFCRHMYQAKDLRILNDATSDMITFVNCCCKCGKCYKAEIPKVCFGEMLGFDDDD